MSRKDWPREWSDHHQALLNFHSTYAHQKGELVELWSAGNVFAVVPLDIPVRSLSDAIPLLKETYNRGRRDGREELAREFRALIGVNS